MRICSNKNSSSKATTSKNNTTKTDEPVNINTATKEELQTIMLAYLSGVDDDSILTNKYELGEYTRVKEAAKIIEEYSGYFIIEEISDPNLQNVEATIRKYATVDNVKYVFFTLARSIISLTIRIISCRVSLLKFSL